MHRIMSYQGSPGVLASDVAQICKVIRDESWKVSGCGLGQGALSCSLFLGEYAASCSQVDLTDQISQLFDRGCNGVVSGKTSWLDFADLALVAQRLVGLGFIQIENQHFFEDIDKLVVSVLENPSGLGGFENPDLGAALYGLRRLNSGAAHFSEPLRQFTSALVSRVQVPLWDVRGSESLRCGGAASLLLVSALAERSLFEKSIDIGRVSMLVERLCQHVDSLSDAQTIPGFQTGELGIGYAVLRAGMCFRKDEWLTQGLQILIDCASLTLEHGIGTLDVASGAAGIALAYHKLYLLSGYDIFRSVALGVKWLTLKARVLTDECNIDQGYSFYHGLTGIGLSSLHWQQDRPEQLNEFLWLL